MLPSDPILRKHSVVRSVNRVGTRARTSPTTAVPLGGAAFWLAVVLTGVGSGVSAALLMRLLELVQHLMWPGPSASLLVAAQQAGALRHVLVLVGAGLLTGAGQLLLAGLSSGNGIDITAAIWFTAGRLPSVRTIGSAVLSILLVGMGVSLGREGAPKQAGAVIANLLADRTGLSDEQRRLLVACGAGAGMSAAYGVPLGGALFALEVLRGLLALRLVLPALLASVIAAMIAWVALPDAPTYHIPTFPDSPAIAVWALLFGPIAGLVSVGYVRAIAWADRNKPTHWRRLVAPVLVMGLLGVVSIRFPQLLGNGQDIAQLAFVDRDTPAQAGGDHPLGPERRARRSFHAVAGARSNARRCVGTRVVCVLAGRAPRAVRDCRGGGRARGDDAGTNLGGRLDDRDDRPRPIFHCPGTLGSRYGHTRIA